MNSDQSGNVAYLRKYFFCLAFLLCFTFCFLAPYSLWWLHESGDLAVERAVEAQASGHFAIFGSGASQDFVSYKLDLYKEVKPEAIAIGSSRVMQFRGGWFRTSFLNMGGVAGNLAVLRSTIDALLRVGKPQTVIMGLDFWWFLPQWEKNPYESVKAPAGSYDFSLEHLKHPWAWYLDGKISFSELCAPFFSIFGKGFSTDRYGILAQQSGDGFGPDGSWYYTAEITGMKKPFDFQFKDTLSQVAHGVRAFYHADKDQSGPADAHVDAFAEIWCKLRSRGIQTFVFIPPLAHRVFASMRDMENEYAHLFNLRKKLQERGINVMDFTDPATLGATDCEFVDGFHGGEVVYARILRQMADHWPVLLEYVNMEKLDAVIRDWKGHALVADERLGVGPEIDFMQMGCMKKR